MPRRGKAYGKGYSKAFDKSISPWYRHMLGGRIRRIKGKEAHDECLVQGERAARVEALEASLAVDPFLGSLISKIGSVPDYSDPFTRSIILREREKDGQ